MSSSSPSREMAKHISTVDPCHPFLAASLVAMEPGEDALQWWKGTQTILAGTQGADNHGHKRFRSQPYNRRRGLRGHLPWS